MQVKRISFEFRKSFLNFAEFGCFGQALPNVEEKHIPDSQDKESLKRQQH